MRLMLALYVWPRCLACHVTWIAVRAVSGARTSGRLHAGATGPAAPARLRWWPAWPCTARVWHTSQVMPGTRGATKPPIASFINAPRPGRRAVAAAVPCAAVFPVAPRGRDLAGCQRHAATCRGHRCPTPCARLRGCVRPGVRLPRSGCFELENISRCRPCTSPLTPGP